MKRTLATVLAMAALLTAPGCTPTEDATTTKPNEPAASNQPREKSAGEIAAKTEKAPRPAAPSRSAAPQPFPVGTMAPEITGADTDGVEFNLSDYRGKVVMIDFWGDW